jgi:transcription antitermination factor NusG
MRCAEEQPMNAAGRVRNLSAGDDASRWYALHTRSNFESKVACYLGAFGIEVFLPDYSSRRHWHDRVKVLRRPLFPGYLFGRLQKKVPFEVSGAPGLAHIVGFSDGPVPIPDEEIESVRRLVDSGLNVSGCSIVNVGSRVRMRSGPLKGVEGRLEKIKSQFRLVVSVELLGRSVAADVDLEGIEILP